MMQALKQKARSLIREFKGKSYIFGPGSLERVGVLTKGAGDSALLVTSLEERDTRHFRILSDSLKRARIRTVGQTASALPNSPREDVFRIQEAILFHKPDLILTASGGSGIDAAKAAIVLASLGGKLDDYFGTGRVSDKIKEEGRGLLPHVAVQTAAGSAAHLTKYSNITDVQTCQKKLIIDEAVVPLRSLFDYGLTESMSVPFTCDGAFDGLAHCLEAYYGARPQVYQKIEEISLTGIELILAFLERAVRNPHDPEAREGLGLATDLGGYAIMVGGTNGAHLTSFSLVDVLPHGRACAILGPYYTVLFSPAIRAQLLKLMRIFYRYGLIDSPSPAPEGNGPGNALAQGLIALSRRVGFPTTLAEIEGLTAGHIEKALRAAKDPQLASKLKNMPVPMTPAMVDTYMRSVLEAARTGDISRIEPLKKEDLNPA
jgi:alcohol dehydrogenase